MENTSSDYDDVCRALMQVKPADNAPNVKCNWKQLHAVASVKIEEHHFASMMKVHACCCALDVHCTQVSFITCRVASQGVERELVAAGVIEVHDNIISLNPNVNG